MSEAIDEARLEQQVGKVIGDHGGVIEFDSQPRRTVFRVFLPISTRGGITPAEAAQHGSG